ncbi:MAG: hypothetical protein NTW87_28710 [Planctomycetota bacterium]|nr:hypothetical protein [Planctomycetota bacterium]
MARVWWSLVILVTMVLGTAQVRAADAGGRAGGRSVPFTIERIVERLGADNALTDELKKKVEAVNEEFTKKMAEAAKKEGVVAAQAEIEKARQAGDRDAIRAAYKKLTEAMGFNAFDEYKKALSAILSEAQIAKLFPQRPGAGEKKAEEKK